MTAPLVRHTLTALAALVVLLACTNSAAAPVFHQVNIAAANAFDLAVSDLNHDSKPDVAMAVAAPSDIMVLLGNGSGGFLPKKSFTANRYGGAIAIADFDSDTNLDLAVTSIVDSTLSMLVGDGTGQQFNFGTYLDIPSPSTTMAAGNLDGDSFPDVVIGADGWNLVTVFFGLNTRLDIATGHAFTAVALGDVDGDGDQDIVGVSSPGTLTVIRNVGLGTFAPPVDYSVGGGPSGLALVDLNVDGHLDAIVAGGSGTLSVMSGSGSGAFTLASTFAVGSGARSPVVADLDQDGHFDVATANGGGSITLLMGDGLGGLADRSDINVTPAPRVIAVADLDSDGRLDLVSGSLSGSTLVLLLQVSPSGTSLAVSPEPSRFARLATLTATVSPATATGTVTFKDGATALATVALANGIASFQDYGMALGAHSLTATYNGDSVLGASTSPTVPHLVIPPLPSSVALSVIPSSSVAGQPVMLEAHVEPTVATGAVDFFDNGAHVGSAAVLAGTATLVSPALCGPAHTIFAYYSGDTLYASSSSSPVTHSPTPTPTTVTVVATPNPARLPDTITLTATLNSASSAGCALTGLVSFRIDGATYAAVPPSSGIASTFVYGLATGTHRIVADYSGSESAQSAMSDTVVLEVEVPRPLLVAVRDVRNDQGGKVRLSWNASYLDLAPYHTIESYWVLRSVPAAGIGQAARLSARHPGNFESTPAPGTLLVSSEVAPDYYWEFLGSQPAFHVPAYSYVAATTGDSLASSNPYTAFMVMARTAGGAQWWFSNADSGYSVDNLPPVVPMAFAVAGVAGGNLLTWQPNPDADLANYRLYRGDSPGFSTDVEHLIVSPTGTSYLDTSPGGPWYKLVAVDVHGNSSASQSASTGGTTGIGDRPPESLALDGARPNPVHTRNELTVWIALPNSRLTQLMLIDASGRLVSSREVGSLGAGRHAVALAGPGRLAPGAYLILLRQGDTSRVRRVIVLQ